MAINRPAEFPVTAASVALDDYLMLDGLSQGSRKLLASFLLDRAHHTGIQSSDSLTEGTTNLFLTAALRTKLNNIEALADVTDAGNVGSSIYGAAAKTSVADTDVVGLIDSAAGNVLKKLTFAHLRTQLRATLDSAYQAADAELAALAGLASAANKLPYFTGSGTAAVVDFTAAGRALLDDADATAQRATLGLVIGTNVQAYHANLAQLAGLSLVADRLPYANGAGTLGLATFTTFGRSLVDDADASAARTTLGLGTLATQSGTFSGTSSGTNTGDQTNITGNAGTATKLLNARTIGGTAFDGSANISGFPVPGPIGATTPSTGQFTALTVYEDPTYFLNFTGYNITANDELSVFVPHGKTLSLGGEPGGGSGTPAVGPFLIIQTVDSLGKGGYVTIGVNNKDSAASSSQGSLIITTSLDQTGNSGWGDIITDRTENAIGSGTHNLIDQRVGGVTKWKVDRTGVLTCEALVVASSSVVANLNSSFLLGKTWAAPGAIGSGTPSTGAFAGLQFTSSFSGSGTVAFNGNPAAPATDTYRPMVIAPAATISGGATVMEAVVVRPLATAAANGDQAYFFQSRPSLNTGTYTGLVLANQYTNTPTLTGTGAVDTVYQHYIAASCAATNRHGLYQAGSSDLNTFMGPVLAANSLRTSSPTGGLGFATGAGGAQTQTTSRSTGVTLSTPVGAITTHNASLAAGASATFTVTNTHVAANDLVLVSIRSGATNKETRVAVTAVAAGSFDITVHNQHSATAETGTLVINFAVIKGVTT